MPDPWTTSSSASLVQGETVTLVEGSAFCISGRSGDIRPEHPEGLFFRDTRFLSELRVRLNGRLPEPLGAEALDPFSAVFVVRDHPRAGHADSHLMLFRRRYVGRGMREDLTLHNYSEEATFCSIEIIVGCDFADLFEVKEGRVEKLGETTVHGEHSRLTFAYRRGGFRRATHVEFSQAPRFSETVVAYEVIVPPRGEWSTCLQLTPVIEDVEIVPRYLCGQPVERSTPVERLETWRRRLPKVTTDHDDFRALLERSTEDLAALRIFDPEHPERAVVAAGAPWFMTLFGRDSLITSWMTMLIDPDLALGTLETLARFQGKEVNPVTEEEPGRILHEMRFGETASLTLGGGRVYYGTADATPLFVMLLGELSRWGVRRAEVDALLPAADRALEWIEHFGDRNDDGYVEYQRTSDRGLENQGWKDSWDSIRFRDGTLAPTPIALCEVQAYVYGALVARSHIATEAGDHELATRLRDRAKTLKVAFNRDFWVDQDGGGYFAMGLDRDHRKIDAIASNMGHCLWTGIVDEEKAPHVAKHLLSDAMFSGWGLRTLSEDMRGYNPISYHNGSVWPHDNAICAAGLMRYGFVEESHRVMQGIVDCSKFFGNLLPELFAGLGRSQFGFPVSYPTSCSPQAWAAASPLLFLRTMLRFEPDIRNAKLHLAPAVPDWIGLLRLEHIELMGGHLTIETERDRVHALEIPEGLRIVHSPRAPTA
ncbi:MAG: Amylo-alpha,6-glucosidase [Actinomycetia bacterium]|nr:Amylo-alpha,6-glucosidase [Actinomycetes bacterium]